MCKRARKRRINKKRGRLSKTLWLLERGVILPHQVGLAAFVLGEGEPA